MERKEMKRVGVDVAGVCSNSSVSRYVCSLKASLGRYDLGGVPLRSVFLVIKSVLLSI